LTTEELPQGYSAATRLLNRMVRDGLLEMARPHQNAPQFYYLPATKAPSLQSYQHGKAEGDLYVAIETLGGVDWFPEAHDEYIGFGFQPDKVCRVKGKIIFWEVDLGTEDLSRIEGKVSCYLKLAAAHPNRLLAVVFTATKGRAKSILLNVLMKVRSRNARFYSAEHGRVLEDPTGAAYASPVKLERFLKLDEI
jgi:hypothetical protein